MFEDRTRGRRNTIRFEAIKVNKLDRMSVNGVSIIFDFMFIGQR